MKKALFTASIESVKQAKAISKGKLKASRRTMRTYKIGNLQITEGSDNIFRDLGLPKPESLKIKSGLLIEMKDAIRTLGLSPTAAAERMGLPLEDLPFIFRGQVADISVRKLKECLQRLTVDINRMRTTLTPHDRLNIAKQAADEGRYAEALCGYVWFHEHALEHEPSQYGVRLSFALNYWVNLAAVYPPALKKLESIRDRKMVLLSKAKGNSDLFHDVVAINQYLVCRKKTYALMQLLESVNLHLANTCGTLAIDAIIEAGDFVMAQRYWPSPEDALLKFSDCLNADVARYKRATIKFRPRLQAYVSNYCSSVQTTLNIMRSTGEKKNIAHARAWAVALVHDRHVRAKVANQIYRA